MQYPGSILSRSLFGRAILLQIGPSRISKSRFRAEKQLTLAQLRAPFQVAMQNALCCHGRIPGWGLRAELHGEQPCTSAHKMTTKTTRFVARFQPESAFGTKYRQNFPHNGGRRVSSHLASTIKKSEALLQSYLAKASGCLGSLSL